MEKEFHLGVLHHTPAAPAGKWASPATMRARVVYIHRTDVMRISTASLAVIPQSGSDGMLRYLAQWNDKWKAFNLVGGHKRGSESHRACLVRELFEELGIGPGPNDPDAAARSGPLCRVARTA